MKCIVCRVAIIGRQIKAEGGRSARWHVIKLEVAGREDDKAFEQSKPRRWLKEEHLGQTQQQPMQIAGSMRA